MIFRHAKYFIDFHTISVFCTDSSCDMFPGLYIVDARRMYLKWTRMDMDMIGYVCCYCVHLS